jgi:stringent starvation protein B
MFSLARRPIRGIKSRNSIVSMRSVTSQYSSEEGEASEYPTSQRSTLESNPDRGPPHPVDAAAAKSRPAEADNSDSDLTVTSVRLARS